MTNASLQNTQVNLPNYCAILLTSIEHISTMCSAHALTKHPDAASIIAGDFNKASLSQVMPNFHQHISCPTRGPNTLDHCYTQFKKAYNVRSLPAFGKSDHAAIFLTPE